MARPTAPAPAMAAIVTQALNAAVPISAMDTTLRSASTGGLVVEQPGERGADGLQAKGDSNGLCASSISLYWVGDRNLE